MRDHCRRHRTAHPAGIVIFVAALVFSGASRAAIIVPVSGGGWATMTAITSVDTAKIVGSLKWTDQLGNVKNFPTATLTRNLPAVAGVARSVLARRLAVGAVVAGVLYESLSTKLGPDVKISADGSAVRPGKTVAWSVCESNLISTTSVSGGTTKYNAYAFLPCQKSYVGPNRLLLRVPAGYGWTPDTAWLSQYGTPTITTRSLPYILAGATLAITGSNFVEYVRPQTDTSTNIPSADTPVTDAEMADALMTPEAIGQLAQADAIPQDFFQPIDLSVDTGTTPPTDGGSEIPDGPDVDDVSTNIFDVMTFVPQIDLRWLPRHCPQWPDIPIVVPELHMDGAIEWPSDRICGVATDFIAPLSRVMAIIIFVSIVFRKFHGGA